MIDILKRLFSAAFLGGIYGAISALVFSVSLYFMGEDAGIFSGAFPKAIPVFMLYGFVFGFVAALISFSFVVKKTMSIPFKAINKHIGMPVFLVMVIMMSIPSLAFIMIIRFYWLILYLIVFYYGFRSLKKSFPELQRGVDGND